MTDSEIMEVRPFDAHIRGSEKYLDQPAAFTFKVDKIVSGEMMLRTSDNTEYATVLVLHTDMGLVELRMNGGLTLDISSLFDVLRKQAITQGYDPLSAALAIISD